MKYTEQIDLLELEIMKFNQSDSRRIQHLVKVHRFAQLIGHMEKLDAHTQFLTECAALVHDIGIRPAEEKYGACNGKLQEQEGPSWAGADKVSVNSAAVKNPQLIADAAKIFGSQCVVAAIDARRDEDGVFRVVVHGGRKDTGLDALEWAKRCQELGAGEILLTSMDTDGCRDGFDLELTQAVCDRVSIPVIASGGCGKLEHFSEVFEKTGADAALAASLFHFRELTVEQVKEHLREQDIPVRRN